MTNDGAEALLLIGGEPHPSRPDRDPRHQRQVERPRDGRREPRCSARRTATASPVSSPRADRRRSARSRPTGPRDRRPRCPAPHRSAAIGRISRKRRETAIVHNRGVIPAARALVITNPPSRHRYKNAPPPRIGRLAPRRGIARDARIVAGIDGQVAERLRRGGWRHPHDEATNASGAGPAPRLLRRRRAGDRDRRARAREIWPADLCTP